jgi:2-keto-3-deoxy-L-rhamnonate aldolase RhmA
MKSSAIHKFRSKLQSNGPAYGVWITLEAAAVSDIATGLGFDWIGIDAAHTALDWQQVLDHIRAAARSETIALVRIAGSNGGAIDRAIALGADGVLVQAPEDAAQLQSIVDHVRLTSGANTLIVPVVAPGHPAGQINELASVQGIELFFVESASSSYSPAEIERTVAEIKKRGKHAGIVAASEQELTSYAAQQFKVVGVGSDAEIIRRGIKTMMEAISKIAKS